MNILSSSSSWVISLKKLFRGVYYFFNEGKIVVLNEPEPLRGLKWKIYERFGIAYAKGYYEPKLAHFLMTQLKPNSVFFDIGGHAGYFSLLGSRLAQQVYTFEPDPDNFKCIQSLVEMNDVKNISVFNLAVGESSREVKFNIGNISSLGRVTDAGNLRVSQVDLDSFVQSNNVQSVDFIKIDVEGYGGAVLEGMQDIIRRFKPVIIMEVHNGPEGDALEKLQRESGYSFFDHTNTPKALSEIQHEAVVARCISAT